jgi:NADPH:quinone reductase-like Zn-dependent oxidoreductase
VNTLWDEREKLITSCFKPIQTNLHSQLDKQSNLTSMNTSVLPKTMSGVLLTGHGGPEKLEYRTDLPLPTLGPAEVLIKVAAAGLNNTDINTRIGWYSKRLSSSTSQLHSAPSSTANEADASWTGAPLTFPRIQGADCCGYIVAVGSDVSPSRIGQRVLVRPLLNPPVAGNAFDAWTFGSECDGAFAQYTKAPGSEIYAVDAPGWTDVELGSIPCAFSTAENMVHRSRVRTGERVIVTGAGGGVGAAAVQLCKRRGAIVVAVAGKDKKEEVLGLGADEVIARGESVVDALGKMSVDVVLDVVAGPQFGELIEVLKRGGRYAVAGAIAGPVVELDVRMLYLKDLSFFGCTYQDREVFSNLVRYIEKGEIRPHVGQVFKLQDIGKAQEVFQSKAVAGKLVLEID